MTQMRAGLAGAKGAVTGPALRPMFDELMSVVAGADGVTFEQTELDGVPGWWARPEAGQAPAGAALIFLHGGAYVVGSATAYRAFVGQIVARTAAPAFIADYRLAPEHPFPGAIDDARRAYDALALTFDRIAIAGDSAGGGLALALPASLKDAGLSPAAAVALSPWADLALESPSMTTRDAADPLASRAALAATATLYLGEHDPTDPLASPVYSGRSGLPPVMIHTGEDEVLLDDPLRFESGAPDIEAHVWVGMVHVFPSSVGALQAAGRALDLTGAFLRRHLGVAQESENLQ